MPFENDTHFKNKVTVTIDKVVLHTVLFSTIFLDVKDG